MIVKSKCSPLTCRCVSFSDVNLLGLVFDHSHRRLCAFIITPKQKNVYLTFVDLSLNAIADSGARALAGALPWCRLLTHVRLSHNRIGSSGAMALAKGFAGHPRLAFLDLRHNTIGDRGACALVELLPLPHGSGSITAPLLREIALSGNRLGDDTAAALAERIANGGGGVASTLCTADSSYGAASLLSDAEMDELERLQGFGGSVGGGSSQGADGVDAGGMNAFVERLSARGPPLSSSSSSASATATVSSTSQQPQPSSFSSSHPLPFDTIDLSECRVGRAGVICLCEALALQAGGHITALHLAGNPLQDAGLMDLAKRVHLAL